MNARRRILSATTLVAIAAGCDSQRSVDDPVGPEPEALGTLQVTVAVNGTQPDPDGYALVVTLASQAAPVSEHVESTGGIVRFFDLPAGSHSLRLEDLAANCTVLGANPRSVTVVGEETSQISFRVFCPGPGTFLIKTVTQGTDLDPDGYTLVFEASSVREQRIGINDSLLIREEDLSLDGDWIIRLDGVPDHCLMGTAVSDNRAAVESDPRRLRLIPGANVRVTFSVTCIQPASMIAFEAVSNSADDIFLATGGSGTVNLTNDTALDVEPALSPDRTRIVFSSNRDFPWDFVFDLYVMGTGGNGAFRLTTSGSEEVGSQAWSPDGSRIVFTSWRDGNAEIYAMNSNGGGVIRLTRNDALDVNPAWSPDGSSIAFCSDRGSTDGVYDVYRMSAVDGSAVVKVASAGCDPVWSPDGSRIAYTTGYDGLSPLDLAVIGTDGTDFVQLRPGEMSSRDPFAEPSWSPDGSWIAFTRGRDPRSEVMIVPFGESGFGEVLKLVDGSSPSWR